MEGESLKRYFNIKELSAYTGLPKSTLYEYAAQGTLPAIKLGRRVLFDLRDIDNVMASNKRESFDPAVILRNFISK